MDISYPPLSGKACSIRSTLQQDVLDNTSIADKRRQWEASACTVDVPDTIYCEVLKVGGVACMLHRPVVRDCTRSALVYIHGGGLVEGSIVTSREWCARLALAARKDVLSIDYRLAPEFPYPAALEDVLAVCRAISCDNDYLYIAGLGADSTGCVLALQALLHMRDAGDPLADSCFLLSPSVDLSFSSASVRTNRDRDALVSIDVLKYYARLYAGDNEVASAKISPLFAELHGLPPVHIHVDESELLLDDAIRLADSIQRSGGSGDLVISRGLWHVWPTWGEFPEAKVATYEIAEHIRKSARQSGRHLE